MQKDSSSKSLSFKKFMLLLMLVSSSRVFAQVTDYNQLMADMQNRNSQFLAEQKIPDSEVEPSLASNTDEGGKLTYGAEFKITSTPQSFFPSNDLVNDEFLSLKIKGIGEFTISVNSHDQSKESFKFQKVIIDSFEKAVFIPFDKELFKIKGASIILKAEILFGEITATFSKESFYSLDFNESVKVWSNFLSEHRFVISINSDLKHEDDNRIQFILQSSIGQQILSGNESLELFINSKNAFPTKNSSQAKATGFLSGGLIKTISKSNSLYCIEKVCKYWVMIAAKEVDFLNFMPSVLANGSEIKFHESLNLLEEIEIGEQVDYVLSVPKVDEHWIFTIDAIEGAVTLYINPDFKEKELKSYKYRAESRRRQSIVITHYEAKSYGFNGEKFYATFKSSKPDVPVTFRFEVKRALSSKPILIEQNDAASGVVAKGEVINYQINLREAMSETLSSSFVLETRHGTADFYLKECLEGESATSCAITSSEIESKASGSRIFRFSPALRNEEHLNKNSIRLNVNCIGMNNDMNNFDSPTIPVSKTCLFTLAVVCADANNKYGTYYKLVPISGGKLEFASMNILNLAKIFPKEKYRYSVYIGNSNEEFINKTLFMKFIMITGKCMGYFSETSKKPNEGDNDHSLLLENDNFSSVHSKVIYSQMGIMVKNPIRSDGSRYVYITIECSEYSIFEFDLRWNQIELTDQFSEVLQNKVIYNRQITEDSITGTVKNNVSFLRAFMFYFDQQSIGGLSKIKIHLSGQNFGLNLCVKIATEHDQFPTKCAFESNNEHLTIDKNDQLVRDASFLIIEVRKIFDAEKVAPHFPIDFTIKIEDQSNFNNIELLHSGRSTSSSLTPGVSQDYLLDLIPIQKNVAVYVSSPDPDIETNIFVLSEGKTNHVAVLTHQSSGMKINRIENFRVENCINNDCKLLISIYSPTENTHRFTITYVADDSPIILKEGEQLSISNNIPNWFIFESDNQSPVSFSVHNEFTESAIFCKMLKHNERIDKANVLDQIIAMSFDFKSNIERDPQIMIPLSFLGNYPEHKILFLVRPILKVSGLDSNLDIEVFNTKKTMTVHLHSKVLNLTPHYQSKSTVMAGEFVYFYFNLDQPTDFSIILTLDSGEASLYLHKEAGTLPTLRRFWKKGMGTKGDEIVVTKEMLLEDKVPADQLYVGVYGKENANFKVLFMPDFKNLVRLKFQQLVDMKLDKDRSYYFSYTNINEEYSTILYSEGSDIEVGALNYKEKMTNFIDMVTDESNYHEKFVFKKGDLPRKKHIQNAVAVNSHTIIRVKPLESNCRIYFAIYDEKSAIEVPLEKSFMFTQNKGEKNVFLTKLDSHYEDVEISIKLEFGEIEVRYSEKEDTFDEVLKISIPSQKVVTYRVKNLERLNDILIFKELFVEVKTNEFSRFSILIKPKNKFLEIRPFEPEIIHASNERDLYVYFTLLPGELKNVHSILIDYQCSESFQERPEFLFISDSEMVINPTSPFVTMPIDDLYERVSGEFIYLEIRPSPQAGSYVLKIYKSQTPYPIKINVSYNNEQNIGSNGIYRGTIPKNLGGSHQYSLYLNQPGEFRIAIESCHNIDIDGAEYHSEEKLTHEKKEEDQNIYDYNASKKTTWILFDQRFRQTASYLNINKTPYAVSKSMKTTLLKIKRGFVNVPGVLRFNVTNKITSEKYADLINKFYVIMTEFRPLTKELILKDYIKLPNADDFTSHIPDYKFVDGKLSIRTRLPAFIPQISIDYPHLNTIVIKLHAYLFRDPDFETKLSDCGLACFNDIPFKMANKTIELTKVQFEDQVNVLYDTIVFESEQLDFLKGESHMQVFCQSSVHFYNNEDEHHQIAKNNKYTSSPYFLLTISNDNRSFLSAHWGIVLLILLTLGFLGVFYFKLKGAQDEPSDSFGVKNEYIRPNSRLEMSSVSMNQRT